ncbi:hypothetical protein [Actinoplanes sp. HUAS TT8]|uniref:hypothetical protein n=1 Tax=Actinoplanes sp. HUAS TT8 TaxID=3447453 RepID=UPI003F523016
MGLDVSIYIGVTEPGIGPAELARELAPLLGYELVDRPASDLFEGGDLSGHAWLRVRATGHEPDLTYPFELELSYTEGPLVPYAEGLFDRLLRTGRFRLALVAGDDCLRSTHLPRELFWD